MSYDAKSLSERQRREDVLHVTFKQLAGITIEAKAVEEAQRDVIKKEKTDKAKAESLLQNSNRILLKVNSVFPFQLFPTSVYVQETKVIIIFRSFFADSESHTIDIKNISNVFIGKGPVFASMEIVSPFPAENKVIVKKLWTQDATRVHAMIEGLRTFQREGINTSSFDRNELIQKLHQLTQKEIS